MKNEELRNNLPGGVPGNGIQRPTKPEERLRLATPCCERGFFVVRAPGCFPAFPVPVRTIDGAGRSNLNIRNVHGKGGEPEERDMRVQFQGSGLLRKQARKRKRYPKTIN
jgi:hypothetical protein